VGAFAIVPVGATAQTAPELPAAEPPGETVPAPAPAEESVATAPARPDAGCGQPDDELRDGEPEPAESATVIATAAEEGTGPPTAHCSQNAGDNQYRDPFANSPPPERDGADSAQAPDAAVGQSTTGSTTFQQDAAATAAAAAAQAGSGEGLPNTGLGLGGLLALGLPLLAGGLVLRKHIA
jgi:hypothetical protein